MNNNFINKLIANDIVNKGIEKTGDFYYIIYLDDYTKNIDNESRQYIYDNKDNIKKYILENENVSALDYNEKENSFDMDFFINSVIDRIESHVYDNAEKLDIELSINDVKNITEKILDDDDFNEDINEIIIDYKGEYEI